MSYQATDWALRQKVAPPARKLVLLVLATYADRHGFCWPSQKTLAERTGMSLDTIQRHTKKLKEGGFLSVTRKPKHRGQWQTFEYRLSMFTDQAENVHLRGAGRHDALALIQTAAPINGRFPSSDCGMAGPQSQRLPGRTAMRLKPSIEPSKEPSVSTAYSDSRARLQAFRANQEAPEVTQNRIARRLGADGWLLLGEISESERQRLTELERSHQLDDDTLKDVVSLIRRQQRD